MENAGKATDDHEIDARVSELLQEASEALHGVGGRPNEAP